MIDLQFDIDTLLRYFAILIRTGGIIFAMPLFGDNPVPVRVKILLSVALTIILGSLIPPSWMAKVNHDVFAISILVLKELLVGLIFGYIARLAFTGLIMCASLVGYQMGFGTSTLFIPDADAQMDSFTAFHRIIMMLIFLGLNLHHLFIKGIVDSFTLLPAGGVGLSGSLMEILIRISAGVFVISLQLSAPILIAMLFTMAALGLIARTVPQVNVFVMSFPISFFLGLIIYIATFPLYPNWLRSHFMTTHNEIYAALKSMATTQ